MFIWVALKENVKSVRILWKIKEVCSNQGFLLVQWNNYQKREPQGNLTPTPSLHGPMTRKVMQRNAWKDIANWRIQTTQQFFKVATPCMDDHQCREEEGWISWRSVHSLLTICSQVSFLVSYLVGRPDSLWSVNKLARAVTKWSKSL